MMREIILKKRYPHSREEDITDAFMRGYEKGKADRPQGEWERVSADKYVQHAYHFYRCSKCGYDHIGKTNFCPNCGARMKGADDEIRRY